MSFRIYCYSDSNSEPDVLFAKTEVDALKMAANYEHTEIINIKTGECL